MQYKVDCESIGECVFWNVALIENSDRNPIAKVAKKIIRNRLSTTTTIL